MLNILSCSNRPTFPEEEIPLPSSRALPIGCALGVIVALGGLFLVLAAHSILPRGVNAISQLGSWGQLVGYGTIALGGFIVGSVSLIYRQKESILTASFKPEPNPHLPTSTFIPSEEPITGPSIQEPSQESTLTAHSDDVDSFEPRPTPHLPEDNGMQEEGLLTLPDEILVTICGYLPLSSRKATVLSCQKMKAVMETPSLLRQSVLKLAKKTAQKIKDDYYRALAWVEIAKAEGKGQFAQAKETAQKIKNDYYRALAWVEIAKAEGKGQFAQAKETAQKIEDDYWRARAWGKIAKAEAAQGQLAQAKGIAQKIQDGDWRAEAGYEITKAEAAQGLFMEALKTSQLIEDSFWRVKAICAVITAL